MSRSFLSSCRNLLLVVFLLLLGCTQPDVSAEQVTENLADIERNLVNDYALTDPILRQQLILQHTGDWLRTEQIQALADQEAAAVYTQLAFSSENLFFDDPSFIARDQELAVIGLPNGLGLYLYVVSAPQTEPVLITEFTIGLNDLEVLWLNGEIGVAYETLDANGRRLPHFALIIWSEEEARWETTWLGDNDPNWWFNALNGTLTVSDDLQSLSITGESLTQPAIFDEAASGVTRQFTINWRRDVLRGEDRFGYVVSPLPDSYNNRTEWLWASTVPSNYGTLVEFIERLQLGEEQEVIPLVATGAAARQAFDFGFDLPGRRYTVLETSTTSITLQGEQGTFVVQFSEEFLITDISPIGAQAAP